MKFKLFLFLVSISLFISCQNAAQQEAIEAQKTAELALNAANEGIKQLKAQAATAPTDLLIHVVYFKAKEDKVDALIEAIHSLKSIPVLKGLQVGTFKDLGDDRALSEYNVVMQMGFEDEAAYKVYQEHPIHLELRENAKAMLTGPPATYDFVTTN